MRRLVLGLALALAVSPAFAELGEHACSTNGVPEAAADIYRQQVMQGLSLLKALYDFEHSTFQMSNVRTIRSEANRALCKATLHVEMKPSALALRQDRELPGFIKPELLNSDKEAEFTVEMTDDGKPFVTVY